MLHDAKIKILNFQKIEKPGKDHQKNLKFGNWFDSFTCGNV
jgi:hypothetical protein